ncbi:MAG: TRAM domain-containing protein, partial [Acidimicrobiia bacterium]
PSATWPDQVSPEEKKARSKELIALGNEFRLEFHRRQVGRTREVLVEEVMSNGLLSGHTDNFVRVRFAPGGVEAEGLVGGLARVSIEAASVESVEGTFVHGVAWDGADPRDVSSN